MAFTKEQAVKAAREFLLRNAAGTDYPVREEPESARLETGDFGSSLGVGKSYWSVVFEFETPNNIVVSPGEVIVLVDEQTGKVAFFSSL